MEIVLKTRKRVGIGIKTMTSRIAASIEKAREQVDVEIFDNAESLILAAKNKSVDAVVRGNLDAVEAYDAVRKILAHEGSIFEVNLYRLNGVNMIDEQAKNVFCILPVSFTNERTVQDKISSIDEHLKFFKKLGITPKLGILAPGKPQDISAGVPEVTAGLEEAQHLVDLYSERGIWAKQFNHQIEKAVIEANIIVAQNSWTGNMAAHCLLYLGTSEYLGGAALNLFEIVFVDDSEAMQDFTNCLILAAFLAEME